MRLLEADIGPLQAHARFQTLVDRMRSAVVMTLRAAEPHAKNRRNSFELYGFDFVIDTDLVPHLLECNLSPALNKRTPYMTSMITTMSDGLVEIALASYKEPTNPHPHFKTSKPKCVQPIFLSFLLCCAPNSLPILACGVQVYNTSCDHSTSDSFGRERQHGTGDTSTGTGHGN